MNTKYEIDSGSENIVYVRPVAVADLPSEIRARVPGLDLVYAVHNAEGERLALVKDRRLAFLLADQNDLSVVTLH